MKIRVSPSVWAFCSVAVLTAFFVSASSQTLGKRKLPGSVTSNVSRLPASYAKATFEYTVSEGVSTANNHEKGMTYLAPMLSSGPDLPANPEFRFKVVGVNTGEWKPVGESKNEFSSSEGTGRLRFDWDNRAKLLKMKLSYSAGSGGSSVGPANETFAIDLTMLDNDAKVWYHSRRVQFLKVG